MTISARVHVTIHCDGGYHHPIESRLSHPATKTQIRQEATSRGWKVTADGKTYCPQHKP